MNLMLTMIILIQMNLMLTMIIMVTMMRRMRIKTRTKAGENKETKNIAGCGMTMETVWDLKFQNSHLHPTSSCQTKCSNVELRPTSTGDCFKMTLQLKKQ